MAVWTLEPVLSCVDCGTFHPNIPNIPTFTDRPNVGPDCPMYVSPKFFDILHMHLDRRLKGFFLVCAESLSIPASKIKLLLAGISCPACTHTIWCS